MEAFVAHAIWDFGLWKCGFHDCVGIRKALRAVNQVLDGRVGDDRRSFPCYPYHQPHVSY
jgi:hypothetical protein